MKKILLFLLLINGAIVSKACTTFFINRNGQLVFGRNYDWITDAGMICTNGRGLSKTSMKTSDGNTISWLSKYGSVTFNQYGKEFPTGGMNEKGLVVELMWLDGTQYPSPDERPAVGVLQWIQYQLDNCSSIDEVMATDKVLRIASKGTTPLHYLVADASGHAATIEFFNGKLTVHRGDELPFPVLTNDTYESSVAAVKNNNGNGGNNSLERFTEACTMLKNLQQTETTGSLTDYSFRILDKVAQGSFTKWSIVYDITNKTVYFKTDRFQQVKNLAFASLDLSCTAVSKAWDINQPGQENINALLSDFSLQLNQQIVERAFEESNVRVHADAKQIEANWQYAGHIKCLRNGP